MDWSCVCPPLCVAEWGLVCMHAPALMAFISVRLWTSGVERSLICYKPRPAGPLHAVERQGVTANDSDGCPEFCKQLWAIGHINNRHLFFPP